MPVIDLYLSKADQELCTSPLADSNEVLLQKAGGSYDGDVFEENGFLFEDSVEICKAIGDGEDDEVLDYLLEKARDRSHLVQKTITDKRGHRRKVWVKPSQNEQKRKPLSFDGKGKHIIGKNDLRRIGNERISMKDNTRQTQESYDKFSQQTADLDRKVLDNYQGSSGGRWYVQNAIGWLRDREKEYGKEEFLDLIDTNVEAFGKVLREGGDNENQRDATPSLIKYFKQYKTAYENSYVEDANYWG